jgi:DNA-directed RNA polymerase subunit RPC12/RpoP
MEPRTRSQEGNGIACPGCGGRVVYGKTFALGWQCYRCGHYYPYVTFFGIYDHNAPLVVTPMSREMAERAD